MITLTYHVLSVKNYYFTIILLISLFYENHGNTPVTANTKDFPYVAFIRMKRRHNTIYTCEGALVKPQWILTTAYCLWNVSPAKIMAYMGLMNMQTRNTDSSVQKRVCKTIKRHDDFCAFEVCNNTHTGYDIGLVEVQKPFKERPNCKVAKLPTSAIEYKGAAVVAIGWKAEHIANTTVLQRMNAKVSKDNDIICTSVIKSPICIGGFDEDNIIGHDGSPLIYEGTVIGIASHYVIRNGGKIDVVYENVFMHNIWLQCTSDGNCVPMIGNSNIIQSNLIIIFSFLSLLFLLLSASHH